MPIYDYKCKTHNTIEEVFQTSFDTIPISLSCCPQDGNCSITRLFSGSRDFILKGRGWFSDGYSNVNSNKSTETKQG